MKLRNTFIYLSVVLAVFLFTSCEESSGTNEDPQRGDVISSSLIIAVNSDWLLDMAGNDPMVNSLKDGFSSAVKAVRLEYWTEGKDGELVNASGAFYVPVDPATFQYQTAALPLLSLQHGTQNHRDSVASRFITNSPEGFLGLLAGMSGYATAIPDYIGFGESTAMHPYIIADLTANAVVDMIRAVRNWSADEGVSLDGQVFLAGYSEGGYATMAAQKAIESEYSDEISLEATVPMAGPFDLVNTVDFILNSGNYASPSIMGFILSSYNYYYDLDMLNTFFQDPYAGKMNDLFSGNHGGAYITSQLPSDMMDYLKSDFVSGFLAGSHPAVDAIITENSLLDWTPQTPMLLIHGDADEIVPYLNSENAYNSFKAKGSDVTFIPVPGGQHVSSAGPAIAEALTYLLGMLGK